VKML